MAAIRQGIRAAMGALLPRSRFLLSGPADRCDVALTFDDGPHPEHTPRLLDRLAALDLKATFFVIGREAERHPAIVTRAAGEGHAIGNHTWSHGEPSATSARVLADEVARTADLLADLTGRRCDRFRPPKGALTAAKCARLWWAGQRIVLWSADPRDYALGEAARLVEWAGAHHPVPGDVVLLHDVHPHATQALDAFAAWRDRGIAFVTLDAWLPPERAA